MPLVTLRNLGANLQQRRLGSEISQAVRAEHWLGDVLAWCLRYLSLVQLRLG